ncbi:MAG: sugar phosphate nucleotidyltransferase [Oscillospiraceae bacterium]|nr:sugar phosphate nucleotidyltransferase [Oscillospiraceae bacterium]
MQKSCIILAAGDGTRMKSSKPKVLMEVAFEPMIDWVMNAVIETEVIRKNIAVIYSAESVRSHIEKKYPRVNTFAQTERKGTGHAVMQAESFLQERGGDVLVLCGDAPFIDTETINESYELHKAHANTVTVITADVDAPFGYGRIIRHGDTVTGIVEEKDCTDEQRALTEVNSGAYWFNAEALLKALPRLTTANQNGEYYLTDTVKLLQNDAGAYKSTHSEITQGANDRRGLRALNDIAFRANIDRHSDNGVDVIGECYIARNVTIGQDTTILPGTVIRDNVTIGKNCTVGPFAHLRPNTRLADGVKVGDFVEVKNANIGEKTSIAHLTYVGDSDIGKGVNFGCGCVTVNYDGVNKARTVVEDNAFIGCNTNLIAPVRVGENAMTAAGSTVNKDVPAGALAVERAELRMRDSFKLNIQRKYKKK